MGKLELSINDNGYLTNVTIVNSGKNYTKNPIIYLVDHLDNHKVYEFVVFAYIDSLGSISKVEFKRDIKLSKTVKAYIGGEITSLSIDLYFKYHYFHRFAITFFKH